MSENYQAQSGQPLGGWNARPSGQYQPPPGPPPGWNLKQGPNDFAPPSGSPPSYMNKDAVDEPPPYDPWMSIPDNALLPPPPSFREEASPTSNAVRDDAIRGHDWCDRNPLWRASQPEEKIQLRLSRGDLRLTSPPNARYISVRQTEMGRTHGRTTAQCTDSILLSDIPIYIATTGQPRTIYFELQVISIGTHNNADDESGIAIGFLAPPYPAWRLPGWHRASLGVHSDDGRRYVDNSYGGRDFTTPFRAGDVVGIGMRFQPSSAPGRPNECQVFFTRNGREDGKWWLHEEKDQDQEDGNVFSLEGSHDLLAAVGCFGAVEFETRFCPTTWSFRP